MVIKLNTIRDNAGARTQPKRVGRGLGSGLGKTCGAGQKGQKSRTGVAIRAFEGGQMPIYKRLPKRGFVRPFVEQVAELNLRMIQAAVDRKVLATTGLLTPDVLRAAGLVRHNVNLIKLLAVGELKQPIRISVTGASAAAIKKVEAAGGAVELIPLAPKKDTSSKGRSKREAQ